MRGAAGVAALLGVLVLGLVWGGSATRAGLAMAIIPGLFLGAVAVAAACCLARRLPLQNVVAVTLIVGFTAVVVLMAVAKAESGKLESEGNLGARWVGVPWPVPLLWVGLVLSGRELARVILRPWRRARNYGYWLLGVAWVLVIVPGVAWEAFGAKEAGWWVWKEPAAGSFWYGVPWVGLVAKGGLALLLLAFVAPWMTLKRPSQQPPDLWPLSVWGLPSGFLLIGCGVGGLWWAAVLLLVVGAATWFLAWRGKVTALKAGPGTIPGPVG